MLHSQARASGRDDPSNDSEALQQVLKETHTATSRKSIQARIVWWESRAKLRGIEPYPLDRDKMKLAAALLKQGRYKSAGQYLYTIKKSHIERGHPWQGAMDMLLNDLRRSCARGLGGTTQAAPLPIDMYTITVPFNYEACANAVEAIMVGCWWMLREIELANLKGSDFRIIAGAGCGEAEITIRASKNDSQAAGCKRTLACLCPSPICPVSMARTLAQGKPPQAHVVQDAQGCAMSKPTTVQLIKAFGAHLG